QNRCDNRDVTGRRRQPGQAHGVLLIESFRDRLLATGLDPTKDCRGDEPAPLQVSEPADRCHWRQARAVERDLAHGGDGSFRRLTLPLVFLLGDLVHDHRPRPHCGRSIAPAGGVVAVAGAAGFDALTLICSGLCFCQSCRFGVMTWRMVFLAAKPSRGGRTPRRATKRSWSKSAQLETLRAFCAAALVSSGLIPPALSRIAFQVSRAILPA